MSWKDIDKRIKDYEEIKEEEEKREPFETLTDYQNNEINGEEALAILEENPDEPFAKLSKTIIESALLTDDEKRKRVIK